LLLKETKTRAADGRNASTIGGDWIIGSLFLIEIIVASMVGALITAPLLSLFVIPAAYFLMKQPHLPRTKCYRSRVHRENQAAWLDPLPSGILAPLAKGSSQLALAGSFAART
jgi:hypothetical protein